MGMSINVLVPTSKKYITKQKYALFQIDCNICKLEYNLKYIKLPQNGIHLLFDYRFDVTDINLVTGQKIRLRVLAQ